MIVVELLLILAVFWAVIALIVKFSGRRYPGDITGDKGNSVDYDDYYVGWNIFAKADPQAPDRPTRTEQKATDDDFTRWESEQVVEDD